MSNDYQIEVMDTIMSESAKETTAKGLPPMDDEMKRVAEKKRKTFDLPTNAVKVDPLR